MLAPWKESYDKPRQHIKKQRHHFADKDLYHHIYSFSSSPVWMWELDHKEGWALKNWCFQIVVLEKTLESPLDCKEIKPINPEGNQPWIFIGGTDGEGEVSFFGHLMHRGDSSDKRPWCWERLKSEREEGGGMSWLDSTADSMDMNFSKFWETVKNREAWHAAVNGITNGHTQF